VSAAPEPSDEVLVRRVRSGDQDAARILFDRHAPGLRARVRRSLPGRLRARLGESDVVQEAYLAVFLGLRDFEDRGEGSFGRWVHGILEHKVVDEVRRHVDAEKRAQAREARIRTRDEGRLAECRQTPSGEAASAEESRRLRARMDGLQTDYRTILRLVHDEGLSLVAAGVRMGRSPDAARMLYGRAVAKLTKVLGRRQEASS
jgi:RNA polymerase sigma-70 factor (ECF subfamily)